MTKYSSKMKVYCKEGATKEQLVFLRTAKFTFVATEFTLTRIFFSRRSEGKVVDSTILLYRFLASLVLSKSITILAFRHWQRPQTIFRSYLYFRSRYEKWFNSQSQRKRVWVKQSEKIIRVVQRLALVIADCKIFPETKQITQKFSNFWTFFWKFLHP